MKLAVNAIRLAPGGGLTVLLGLLEGWRTIGADLDIVIFAARQAVIDALENEGWGPRVRPVPIKGDAAVELWHRRELPRLVDAMRADVFLTVNYYVSNISCAQIVHHQSLFSVFDPRLWKHAIHGPRRLMQALLARKGLDCAAANVFISNYMRDRAELIRPHSRPRNHVIHNGISQRLLDLANAPVTNGEVTSTIAGVQYAIRHKDNDSLLLALRELVRREPDGGWLLELCGGGDWHRWEKMAEGLGIRDRVHFRGHLGVGDLIDLYRSSRCLVFPSLVEAFGLPIVEAMACGCPVVTVNSTALPEVAGDAAILVEPRSPDQIASAVLRVRDDPALRQGLIERGRTRVREHFTWASSAEAFYRVFEQVT